MNIKTMKKYNDKDFVPAKRHVKLSSGNMIRMLRELKEWTQAELAKRSGISATNISLLENDHVEIGKKRAEALARAFNIHPATIMFPGYETTDVKLAA
jgi:transcriptional regulator with XRE-family HTH domain